MIGSGLKKFAVENGLQVSHGVAYGSLRGYASTLSEGSGYKQIIISTKFSDPVKQQELQAVLNQKNITKEYRLQSLLFAPNGIRIVFSDTVGTMKKIAAFVDWFYPLLPEYGASNADFCSECGGQLTGGTWKMVNGIAFHMHESCAQHLRDEIAAENETRKFKLTYRRKKNETRKLEAEGSYGMGLLGALLGSAIGAIVWAFVLLAGYVASLVGLLIGFLAEKGYTLLKGKQGKGKIAILIIAIILGVVLGTFAADAITLVQMINNQELNIAYGDIPAMILLVFSNDAQYRSGTLGNILIGLLFAGLGVFALLRKTGKEVADTKFVDLT